MCWCTCCYLKASPPSRQALDSPAADQCSLLPREAPCRSALQLARPDDELGVCMQVTVDLSPERLHVRLWETTLLQGRLYAAISRDGSTWYVQDGILHLQLLKRSRRGQYADGCCNADTFWRGVLATCGPEECLPAGPPPVAYYSSWVEPEDLTRSLPARRIAQAAH